MEFDLYLNTWIAIAGVHIIALLSPGPDNIVITQSSLRRSKDSGIWTALGVTTGMIIHVLYTIAGLSLFLSENIFLFNLIKTIGALYLIYIGIKSFMDVIVDDRNILKQQLREINCVDSFKLGLITNLVNPKVSLYYLSFFSQFIKADTPFIINFSYGLEAVLLTLIWCVSLSFIISHDLFREKILKVQKSIEKVMGGTLIFLGLALIFNINL